MMKPEHAREYRDAAARVAQHGVGEAYDMSALAFRALLSSSLDVFVFCMNKHEVVLYLLFMALVAEDSEHSRPRDGLRRTPDYVMGYGKLNYAS